MKSNTESKCDFCGNTCATVYRPSGTRRDMDVVLCQSCGLVQSVRSDTPMPEWRQTTSSDADWGNVRHGKGARLAANVAVVKANVPLADVNRVLDIGSNRGSFVLWLHDAYPSVQVLAVEPDKAVVDNYSNVAGIDLVQERFENIELVPGSVDFIYSSHTLEHAGSALEMLKKSHDCLADGGWMFLEVPNLEAIGADQIVEEYFIDKHTFHFDRESLVAICRHMGFEMVHGVNDTDVYNATLVMRKAGPRNDTPLPPAPSRVSRNAEIVERYAATLPRNRSILERMVSEKLAPLANRQRVGYWGAGRIFDALVKFGGLRQEDVSVLVDGHLVGLLPSVHGITVHKPEVLKSNSPDVVVVLGRTSEGEMAQQAHRFGIRHVIKFSDLFAQCQ